MEAADCPDVAMTTQDLHVTCPTRANRSSSSPSVGDDLSDTSSDEPSYGGNTTHRVETSEGTNLGQVPDPTHSDATPGHTDNIDNGPKKAALSGMYSTGSG